ADQFDSICTCYGIEIGGQQSVSFSIEALRFTDCHVLRTARDGEPIDGVFWATDRMEKALEYGGREQVLLVYDPRVLKPAWVEIGPECTGALRRELERDYPTLVFRNGETSKRSRLPASEYNNGIGYDHYAQWIPGNPFDALVMLIVIGRPGYPLGLEVSKMITDCDMPIWQSGTPAEQASLLARTAD